MRDHEDRAVVVGREERLEPLDRRGVEVVGRFVEDGERRPRDEEAREGDAAPFAAAHRRDRTIALEHAEALEHVVDDVIARPAAEVLDAIGERSLLRDQLGVGFAVLDALRDLRVARGDRGPLGETFRADFSRGLRAVELGLLGEVEDGRVASPVDDTFVGRLRAREHAQERRFARAVDAEQADALPARDRDRDAREERLRPVGLRHAARAEDRHQSVALGIRCLMSRSMSRRSPRSPASQNEMARPARPARPVRPMRCT